MWMVVDRLPNEEMTTDNSRSPSGAGSSLQQRLDPDELDLSATEYDIYECPECDNIVLTVRPDEASLSCHGRDMETVSDVSIDVRTPDLRQVLLDAFGLPKAGLDICLCVIGEGPLSAGEVADILDYDRSTITRYLNELVGVGLLAKAELNRDDGGVVNVYHSIDLDEMRRETLLGFYAWAGEAASLIEEANLTKEAYLETDYSDGLQEIFWDEFDADG